MNNYTTKHLIAANKFPYRAVQLQTSAQVPEATMIFMVAEPHMQQLQNLGHRIWSAHGADYSIIYILSSSTEAEFKMSLHGGMVQGIPIP